MLTMTLALFSLVLARPAEQDAWHIGKCTARSGVRFVGTGLAFESRRGWKVRTMRDVDYVCFTVNKPKVSGAIRSCSGPHWYGGQPGRRLDGATDVRQRRVILPSDAGI